jgi:uroporphyrinogen decarboxylase
MLKSLISASLGKDSKVTPIWFMRQAGRYLPEYREIRSKNKDFIQFILNSDAAAEVTIQPLKRFDLNAAIIFSDILIVPYAMGVDVKFIENVGPVITPVEKFINIDKEKQNDVFSKINKSISIVSKETTDKDIAMIGFAGAPWTVMCYMIEGKLSKNFQKVRSFYISNPSLWEKIIDQLIESTIEYLIGQIEAGAEVIKLFDSWAGAVPHRDFEKLIIDPTKKITKRIKDLYPNIPIIGFPRGAGVMYVDYAKKAGVDVLAIDQNIPIEWAKNNLQTIIALQGNMDNMILAYGENYIEDSVKEIMEGIGRSRFIFNLGHGVLPETNINSVLRTIDAVRKYEATR